MSDDEETLTHPSYGSIGLSRISSNGVPMFGSSVTHHGTVCLTVSTADAVVDRRTGEMRLHTRKQLVMVEMTEAQFAQFISTWNHAGGTPCTLRRRPEPDAKLISCSAPPPERSARDTFDEVIATAVDGVAGQINEVADAIEKLVGDRLPKRDAVTLARLLSELRSNPRSNLKFAQTMLHESLERMLGRARVEMEAAARSVVERLGLAHVADAAAKLLPQAFTDLDPDE